MKAFIVFAAVLACAYAKPQIIYSNGLGNIGLGGIRLGGIGLGGIQYAASPITYSAAPAITYAAAPIAIAPAVTSSQYHAQDELGQYTYGYAGGPSAKSESKDAFGNVRGAYSYLGADGKEVRVNYVADAVNGFRVESNALPVAPAVPVVAPLVGPAPVQDTPEVVEARAAHQKAIEEAQVRNAEAEKQDVAEGQAPQEAAPSRRKRSVVALSSSLPLTYAASPILGSSVVGYSTIGANTLTYAAHPAVGYSTHVVSAPAAVTYAAAPAVTYAAAPAVVAAQPLREATLTKTILTPNHAVAYRVD